MDLNRLLVLHLSKSRANRCAQKGVEQGAENCEDLSSLLPGFDRFFRLETCQRWLAVGQAGVLSNSALLALRSQGVEVCEGQDAYHFLLRFACGLESQILGETDVFGQLKEAWRVAESSYEKDLGALFRRLFEDTKEIRTKYLQHVGGTSYGSLLRKLLKGTDGSLTPDTRVLLVGAGQIAHSIAPFLLESRLSIWNRTAEKSQALRDHLLSKARRTLNGQVQVADDEEQGWKDADVVVICTPLHDEKDPRRLQWLSAKEGTQPTVVHLGVLKENCGIWADISQFFCLSDLFELENSIKNVRSVQIAQAFHACSERALSRAQWSSDFCMAHGLEPVAALLG